MTDGMAPFETSPDAFDCGAKYGINSTVFKIFDRYILREVFPPFLLGLIGYSFVLLMNQILVLSELFISKGVSLRIVISLLGYLVPSILAFTVPMAVLMGILAGLSRMSSDVEVTALKTLGVGTGKLLRPILSFALGGVLVTTLLTMYMAPRWNYKWVQTFSRSVLSKVQVRIHAREFNEDIPDTVIYVQDISADDNWRNIFVYFAKPQDEPRIVLAKRGRLNFYGAENRASLELYDGVLHSFPRSEPEKYRVTSFRHLEEEIPVESIFSSVLVKKRVREKDIRELRKDFAVLSEELAQVPPDQQGSPQLRSKVRDYHAHQVEIHKKYALPFACLIFAFLGVSLGASTRKGGRTSGFTISIAVIVIYYIMITAGEQMAMEGRLSPFLGMWGPNFILCLGSIYFFVLSFRETPGFLLFKRLIRWPRKKSSGSRAPKSEWKPFPSLLRFPNILDRYVLKKYIVIFLMAFCSMIAIFIIVTFFERIDSIYEHNKPLGLFFRFLWYKTPEFIHYALPVSALVSALLSLGLLTKFNETTAVKACGISLFRLICPILMAAGIVSFFSFYLQENILPYSNKKAEALWMQINDVPARTFNYLNRRWVMGAEGNKIYHYVYFDPVASSFGQFSILEIDTVNWEILKRTYAEKAFLKQQRLTMNRSWVRTFDQNRPADYAKHDEWALTQKEDQSYFLKEWKEPDQMNYSELDRYIREIDAKGFDTTRFRVDLFNKLSFPLASLIMTMLGIPFAFSMGKRGTLVGLGLSLAIVMVYWGALGIFKNLGYVNYLHAFLAAWGPNLIFGLGGISLLMTLRT